MSQSASRENRVRLIEQITAAAVADLDECLGRAPDSEPHVLVGALREGVLSALEEIKSKVKDGAIHPELPLRLSITDGTVRWPEELRERRQKVGVLATTGDPLHWQHILVALRAVAAHDLHAALIQVMGDHPHKRERKQPKEHRHAIARRSLEYFFPLLRYTPLGYDNLKVGEENAAEIVLLNYDLPLDLCFIAAGDVRAAALVNLTACRDLLSVIRHDTDRPQDLIPTLSGLFFTGSNPPPEVIRLLEGKDFVQRISRNYVALPKIRGQGMSSTLFRRYPDLPLLPTRALEYVKVHCLYCGAQAYETHRLPRRPLDSVVVVAYLTPEAYASFEGNFCDVEELGSLIPHGPIVKSGKLDGIRVSFLRGFGKETTILPIVRRPEVKSVFAVGLCGALQTYLRIGDLVLPTCAIRGEGITPYWQDARIPALPDARLLHELESTLSGDNARAGPLYTTASLAREQELLGSVGDQGILGVEMDLALHLTLCQLHHKRAAAVYVVSDSVALGEEILEAGITTGAEINTALARAADAVRRTLPQCG